MLNVQIRCLGGKELRAFSEVNTLMSGAFVCSKTRSESESEALLSDAVRSEMHGSRYTAPEELPYASCAIGMNKRSFP